MAYIKETLETEISYECDTLVAGGGFAGISAALAAARNGAKVLLCEREFGLGGLATLGLVTIYLPLCDGCGNQMSFGIAEELFRLSIKYSVQDRYPKAWLEGGSKEEKANERFMVQFNAAEFQKLSEELLIKEGVKILYGTAVCAVQKENDKIRYVLIENKTGRSAVAVKNVVDCTGDADVCFLSGEDTVLNPRKNPLAAWYYSVGKQGLELVQRGYCDVPVNTGETALAALTEKKYDAVTAEELTEMMVLSRKSAVEHIIERREGDQSLEIVTLPTIPQVRMSRRIKGMKTIDYSHRETPFNDSIGVIGGWRREGIRVEIPFTTLYGRKVKNLITAGRCTAAEGDMWDLTRVIPCCAVTGQAAGTAAAMCDDFSKLSVNELQDALRKDGVRIHIEDCM